MKKLELKNLKVKKLSKEEQSTITGGQIADASPSGPSECCVESAWPIDCGKDH